MASTRIISVIGRKNAGKTTLAVALTSELVRRGHRVMTIKHGHHPADVDRAGSDTWRHFNEGRAERVLIASPDLRVLFERSPDDYDPIGLARRYMQGADIVLTEGFKAAPLPKIEVFRRAAGDRPLYDASAPNAREWVAIVTDDPDFQAECPVLRFHDTIWLQLARQPGLGAVAGPRLVSGPLGAAEAAGRILTDVRRQPALRMPLDDALGGVLAEDVVSPLDIPAWTNSAMDGYAARGEDVRGASGAKPGAAPGGRTPACRPISHPQRSGPGECARIFTGAPLPEGADSVIRQEDTDQGADTVTIVKDRDVGVNTRRAGEDIRKGSTVLTAGTELGPAQLGVLASLAVAHPLVYRRPRVAILGSGDEIVDVDQPEEILSGRKIASSNTHTLVALVRQTGGEPVNLGIAADTPESLREHLARAMDCDLLVTTAGISVGEHDYVRSVLDELGAQQRFWKLRMRPGAPVGFGLLGEVPWIGLPGNPVSTMVTYELFVHPAIRRMMGHQRVFRRSVPVRMAEPISLKPKLQHFLRGIVTDGTERPRGPAHRASGLRDSHVHGPGERASGNSRGSARDAGGRDGTGVAPERPGAPGAAGVLGAVIKRSEESRVAVPGSLSSRPLAQDDHFLFLTSYFSLLT